MVRVYFTRQVLITPKPTAEIVSLVNDTLFKKKFYYDYEKLSKEPKGNVQFFIGSSTQIITLAGMEIVTLIFIFYG